jgi:hypothetical protein
MSDGSKGPGATIRSWERPMFFMALQTAPTFPDSWGRERMITISCNIMVHDTLSTKSRQLSMINTIRASIGNDGLLKLEIIRKVYGK